MNAEQRLGRSRNGGYDLHLPAEERALLASLALQLQSLLDEVPIDQSSPIPTIARRLFPRAYSQDDSSEAAYSDLMRAELLDGRRSAAGILLETSERDHLDEAQLDAWLKALNDLRLVLGSSLEVTEVAGEIEPDDPRYSEWICYQYLTFVLGEVVDLLADGLDERDDQSELPDDPWGEPPGGLRWDGTDQPPETNL